MISLRSRGLARITVLARSGSRGRGEFYANLDLPDARQPVKPAASARAPAIEAVGPSGMTGFVEHFYSLEVHEFRHLVTSSRVRGLSSYGQPLLMATSYKPSFERPPPGC
jgi:hypothetical protein